MKVLKPKKKPQTSEKANNDSTTNYQQSSKLQKGEQKYQNMETDDNRRAITYEIAKNKGLTPHRKKDQRNPRVKYKNKYRKAVIRRKGAVRDVRKELKRYDGEYSGINITAVKSIKIK